MTKYLFASFDDIMNEFFWLMHRIISIKCSFVGQFKLKGEVNRFRKYVSKCSNLITYQEYRSIFCQNQENKAGKLPGSLG